MAQALWWQVDADERAAVVKTTCDHLEKIYLPRRRRCLRNMEIYEGRRLGGLHPYAYFNDDELSSDRYDMQRLNLGRALVNTAMAKIAGKQRPKAQFCVTDADWTTKRKAKKLERFVEAQLLARQENLHDAWAVSALCLRDCAVTDWGVLKFSADTETMAVRIERVLPWELFVDPFEARYGSPRNFFHVYGWDRDDLAMRYPRFKDAIMSAPSLEEENISVDSSGSYAQGKETSRMIKVRECHRLAFSPRKPGVHSMCVGGVDVIQGEDWARAYPPYEVFTWEPWMCGLHGTSLIDNVANIADEVNAAMSRWSEAERLCSNGVFIYEEGSVDQDKLESNQIGITMPVKPGTLIQPQYTAPNSVSQTSIEWLQFCWGKGFEVPGISQQAATSQKVPGVDAAIAMRTIENIGSERLAMPWQMYERVMAIGAARQILACAREASDGSKETVTAKWPGAGFMLPIKLSEVDLDEDQYTIQICAVSGLVNTPADRLQVASELLDRGAITMDAYLRVIQYKDIDSELGKTTTQGSLLEKYIEQWLDATPEKENDGDFRYRPPIPFMALEEAILQVGRAYMDAELDEAPDYNLGFFLRFMDDCDRKIQDKAAKAAALQAAAQGKVVPTPGVVPGAPPPMAAPPPGLPPANMNGAMVQ